MVEPDLDLEPLGGVGEFQKLPHLHLQFFMPQLTEKPQDPIMDALGLIKDLTLRPVHTPHTPSGVHSRGAHSPPSEDLASDSGDFWIRALQHQPDCQTRIKSWDNLRASSTSQPASTPFLSEQPSNIFASIIDLDVHAVHATEAELLDSLQAAVIGTSSQLFRWSQDLECFKFGGKSDTGRTSLLVDDWDERLVASYINRFLSIGTALRRLDSFISGLRQGINLKTSTTHSFAHALASTVDYYRDVLTSAFQANTSWRELTSSLWLQHAEAENVVTALSSMCGRDLAVDPRHYTAVPNEPEGILSLIFSMLLVHTEKHSSRLMTATFAYLLTVTCAEYFEGIGRSVGFLPGALTTQPAAATLVLGDEDSQEDDLLPMNSNDPPVFPQFFSSHVVEVILRTRMSLKLLRAARPDHHIFNNSIHHRSLAWFWTEDEVKAALNGALEQSQTHRKINFPSWTPRFQEQQQSDEVLAIFKVFDLEPGSRENELPLSEGTHQAPNLFIGTFPNELPALTPTLPHLLEVVMAPLLDHCHDVSSALLSHILSPASNLHLISHLRLVRDYLLLASPSFKGHLSRALLSDHDDREFEGSTARALARSSSRPSTASISGDTWAVGLGLGLSERTSWPPGGSDLSFYLRTVILDSLEIGNQANEEDLTGRDAAHRLIVDEAEARLGFSIRDLPIGPGRDKWLDPCSIEALDFLLMTYKAKPPLDVVITEEALSRCQRIFTFTLRLLRVQHATNALYRMTRDFREPLFPTLVRANKQLLSFRFMAQNFVQTLLSYVLDSVVRDKYDAFLTRLDKGVPAFPDIFSLAETYSAVLDECLSACLLRSTQRVTADLLRSCLEIVLDLCTVCGEMQRGRLEEYSAAPLIEDLFARFRKRMVALIKALKNLVGMESDSPAIPLEHALLRRGTDVPAGGVENLYHLLVKFDASEWWLKGSS